MQTIGEESHNCREQSNPQFNTERNVIRNSQCDRLLERSCSLSHTNECENWCFADQTKLRQKSNETEVKIEEEISFHFSDEVNESEIKAETTDIPSDCLKRQMSPIEELRTDGKDWHRFHTSTSTPTSNRNVFPDVCISLSQRLLNYLFVSFFS